MTTYLGKSCSFCLPRVPFVNCRQFMYLVISLLVLRAGYGIWLYQFLIIAYLFTLVYRAGCGIWLYQFLIIAYLFTLVGLWGRYDYIDVFLLLKRCKCRLSDVTWLCTSSWRRNILWFPSVWLDGGDIMMTLRCSAVWRQENGYSHLRTFRQNLMFWSQKVNIWNEIIFLMFSEVYRGVTIYFTRDPMKVIFD